VQLRPESSHGLCVLQVRGRVGDQDASRLVDTICGALDDHPRGVVVDLERVTDLSDAASRALRELALGSDRWPEPSIVLCSPTPERHSGLTGVEVHSDRETAVLGTQTRPAGPSVRVDLRAGLRSPAQARAAVAALSDELGLADLEDDVTLVVSEMVTNAFRHATPPVALEIHSEDHRVLVSVDDGSAEEPAPRDPDEAAEGGRGLLLVDLLCDEHGVRPDPPGKTVWAALSRGRRTPPTPLRP
jgi:anti-sigma regulatory factor (Ser/Thr protein kinase)/anti-anti-sigma regulatory factor